MSNILLFLNISGGEIILILVVVYLVFGPKKIPELARMLGKGINEMRRATSEIKNEISREISATKKDINLDIDLGDPLGIKKTVEDSINPKKGNSSKATQSNPEDPTTSADKGIPETKAHKPAAPKKAPPSGKKKTKKKSQEDKSSS